MRRYVFGLLVLILCAIVSAAVHGLLQPAYVLTIFFVFILLCEALYSKFSNKA